MRVLTIGVLILWGFAAKAAPGLSGSLFSVVCQCVSANPNTRTLVQSREFQTIKMRTFFKRRPGIPERFLLPTELKYSSEFTDRNQADVVARNINSLFAQAGFPCKGQDIGPSHVLQKVTVHSPSRDDVTVFEQADSFAPVYWRVELQQTPAPPAPPVSGKLNSCRVLVTNGDRVATAWNGLEPPSRPVTRAPASDSAMPLSMMEIASRAAANNRRKHIK